MGAREDMRWSHDCTTKTDTGSLCAPSNLETCATKLNEWIIHYRNRGKRATILMLATKLHTLSPLEVGATVFYKGTTELLRMLSSAIELSSDEGRLQR